MLIGSFLHVCGCAFLFFIIVFVFLQFFLIFLVQRLRDKDKNNGTTVVDEGWHRARSLELNRMLGQACTFVYLRGHVQRREGLMRTCARHGDELRDGCILETKQASTIGGHEGEKSNTRRIASRDIGRQCRYGQDWDEWYFWSHQSLGGVTGEPLCILNDYGIVTRV